MIFSRNICSNLSAASGKEWLETNGLGGFASSTIPGLNTRRYHALLVAATRPPANRVVLAGKLEETLKLWGRPYELSTNRYPGVVYPAGYRSLQEFRLDPWPVSVYAVEDVLLEKRLFMVQGEDTTVVRYRLLAGSRPAARLELALLSGFRDFHSLAHANPGIDGRLNSGPDWISISPYPGIPSLYVNHNGAEVSPGGDWYYRFQYECERARGLDFEEDLYHVCTLKFDLDTQTATVILSTTIRNAATADALEAEERRRRADIACGRKEAGDFVEELGRASSQFLVTARDGRNAVIAGYPWFGDWGRDTMVSLPGLTLATHRYDTAREILVLYAQHCSEGMLPNRFPESGADPEYNTVDATLWYFQAIFEFARHTGDYDFVRNQLYGTLLEIMQRHAEGTRFGIRLAPDGLLECGFQDTSLTWMDARIDGRPVTPRAGKPVEVQALWYNALRIVQYFAHRFGDRDVMERYGALAETARLSFSRRFWNEPDQCLYDCIGSGDPDASMRPNQIFAASLPFTMLSRTRMRQVVSAVTRELLTPVGLRSLAPGDSRYQGRYRGGPAQRDAAYHQGTVWSWLIGPYISARLRAYGRTRKNVEEAAELLLGLQAHLREAGLGTISEIFDGDTPHEPRGCIAQAWSVAEVLRIMLDEIGAFQTNGETALQPAGSRPAGQKSHTGAIVGPLRAGPTGKGQT